MVLNEHRAKAEPHERPRKPTTHSLPSHSTQEILTSSKVRCEAYLESQTPLKSFNTPLKKPLCIERNLVFISFIGCLLKVQRAPYPIFPKPNDKVIQSRPSSSKAVNAAKAIPIGSPKAPLPPLPPFTPLASRPPPPSPSQSPSPFPKTQTPPNHHTAPATVLNLTLGYLPTPPPS